MRHLPDAQVLGALLSLAGKGHAEGSSALGYDVGGWLGGRAGASQDAVTAFLELGLTGWARRQSVVISGVDGALTLPRVRAVAVRRHQLELFVGSARCYVLGPP